MLSLKGQSHEIFDPRFFVLNCTPGSPDSWAKTVLHLDSNSRSYSRTNIDSALCRIARSRLPAVRSKIKFIVWHYLTKQIEYLREFESICKTVLVHE
jgi:hypothetical protein